MKYVQHSNDFELETQMRERECTANRWLQHDERSNEANESQNLITFISGVSERERERVSVCDTTDFYFIVRLNCVRLKFYNKFFASWTDLYLCALSVSNGISRLERAISIPILLPFSLALSFSLLFFSSFAFRFNDAMIGISGITTKSITHGKCHKFHGLTLIIRIDLVQKMLCEANRMKYEDM